MTGYEQLSPVPVNEQMLAKSKFVKRYRTKMVTAVSKFHPEYKTKDIEKVIDKLLLEQAQSPGVALDNNYTGAKSETTLVSLLDWLQERKPIIAGNATFYKNQDEAYNPAAVMLQGELDGRAQIKARMFTVNPADRLYADLDRGQQNKKLNANAYYGGSGAKTSAFYSLYSGPATTLSAQSVIATTECMFESAIGDNYYFMNITELMDWLQVVEKSYDKERSATYLNPVAPEKLLERLHSRILNKKKSTLDKLIPLVGNMEPELVSFVYYKNNMVEYINDHDYVRRLIHEIFSNIENLSYYKPEDDWYSQIPEKYQKEFQDKSCKQWNSFVDSQYFINPNKPPESIMKELKELTDYLMEFVYVQYMAFDRIYRLRNMTRRTVTVIDTDSNILALDTAMRYLIKTFFPKKEMWYYGRPYPNNVYIGINILTYFITTAVNDILLNYGKKSNVPEKYRKYYSMKNEFMFAVLVIGDAKKRYLSSILLREGTILNPPKADIKGFDFKKATCSEYAEKRFMSIIKNRILTTDQIDVRGIMQDIYAFRDEIRDSILSGQKDFLPPAKAKEMEAYKNPATLQSVKAIVAWDRLYPEHPIDKPSTVKLLKLNIFKEQDIDKLRDTEPEIYNRIINEILHDDTGFFVKKKWVQTGVSHVENRPDWINYIPEKYRKEYRTKGRKAWNQFVKYEYRGEPSDDGYWEYEEKGFLILAIPSNADIPKWVLPYVNVNLMVNTILAPFRPVLDILHIKALDEGKNVNGINLKSKGLSRIVNF